MLISCPKCHSIYEIPDDLIKRTGQNFRCQACANVWHAMREDAIGYEEPSEEEPYIEAIPVFEPPHRNYPANKTAFNIPADSKSGRKTRSSKDILEQEGDTDMPLPKIKRKKEITLTSDMGTSFTISAAPLEEQEEEQTRFFLNKEEKELTANATERLQLEKPFKGYKKTYALLVLIIIAAFVGFFRREITSLFPKTEEYYNRIHLTGLNNPEYLSFRNIEVSETTVENKPMLKINAKIYNNSFYTTNVPNVTISGSENSFTPARARLEGHEETSVEVLLPKKENPTVKSLVLSFKKF